MSEVITVQDLQNLKKHEIFEAEVITGKAGGVAGGATIATATNQVTGQVQKTLPQVLSEVLPVKVYANVSAGLAGTTSGQYFSVLSGSVAEYVNLYLNSAGVAVLQKTYPSSQALDDWQRKYPGLFLVNPYYEDAGNALYFKPSEYQTTGNYAYIRGGYLADAQFSYDKIKNDLLAAGIPANCDIGVTSPLGVTDCIKIGGITTLWYEPVSQTFSWGARATKHYYVKVLEYNVDGVAKCEEYPLVVDGKHKINSVKVDSKIPCQVITASTPSPYIPNIDVAAKTLTFYGDTILEAGWSRHVLPATTIIDLSVIASTALIVYYDKVGSTFVVRAWNNTLTETEKYNFILVADLRLGSTAASTHMSISCPYSVNGREVALEVPLSQPVANIFTPLSDTSVGDKKLPEFTVGTRTLTLYKDTILQTRDTEWVLTSDQSINVGTASTATRVWWNTATNTLETDSYSSVQTQQQLLDRVLVATIRVASGSASMSIACPYTVNGELFGAFGTVKDMPLANIYTPLDGASAAAPKLPEYTTTTRTFTLFSSTILQVRDREWALSSDTSIIIPATSSANRIWWNTATDTLETDIWHTSQTNTNIRDRVLVASIRQLPDGYAAISMLCPYTVNGRLFSAVSPGSGLVHNPLDANIKGIMHRGGAGLAPENTLPAYKKSAEIFNYYVEGDIQWTSDQIPVLLHDATIDRTSDGTGAIADMTFAQARTYDFGSWFSPAYTGTPIPSFEEVLRTMKNLGLHGVFEVKSAATTSQINGLFALLNRTGMVGKIQFDCIDTAVLHEIVSISPSQNVGRVVGALSSAIIDQCVTLKTGQNKVVITAEHSTITEALVQESHEKGIDVVAWTVNTSADAVSAANKGVDGIVTDSLNIAQVLRDNAGI